MNKLLISPEALEDLKSIKKYISGELCNEQAAQNVVSKIMKSIRTLERFPKTGTLLSSKANIVTGYRFIVSGNYLTFYRIEDETVYISRVLYGRRDFNRILFGESFFDEQQ